MYQNLSVLPPPPPPLSHLHRASALLGMIYKHKGPSSPARDTINLGLMSDAGEAAASKRAINNSPACVIPQAWQQESRNQAALIPSLTHSMFFTPEAKMCECKRWEWRTYRQLLMHYSQIKSLWMLNYGFLTPWKDYRENQQLKDGWFSGVVLHHECV